MPGREAERPWSACRPLFLRSQGPWMQTGDPAAAEADMRQALETAAFYAEPQFPVGHALTMLANAIGAGCAGPRTRCRSRWRPRTSSTTRVTRRWRWRAAGARWACCSVSAGTPRRPRSWRSCCRTSRRSTAPSTRCTNAGRWACVCAARRMRTRPGICRWPPRPRRRSPIARPRRNSRWRRRTRWTTPGWRRRPRPRSAARSNCCARRATSARRSGHCARRRGTSRTPPTGTTRRGWTGRWRCSARRPGNWRPPPRAPARTRVPKPPTKRRR